MSNNVLSLTVGQQSAIANGSDLILNARQKAHLQAHGLIAGPDQTWIHRQGTFCLAPSYGMDRRFRIDPNGEKVKDRKGKRPCRNCSKLFEQKRSRDNFCSPVCVTKFSQGRKAA